MRIKFNIPESSKNPTPKIRVRVYEGSSIDVTKSLPIIIDKSYWSNKSDPNIKGRHLPPDVIDAKDRLVSFESFLRIAINDSMKEGDRVDSIWLQSKIEEHFKGSKKQKHSYLTDYIEDYISKVVGEKKGYYGQALSKSTIKNYRSTLSKLKEFEGIKKTPLTRFDIETYKRLRFSYLQEKLGLNDNTIGNYIKHTKSFLRKAEEEGYSIHPDINKKQFKTTVAKATDIFLNHSEIEQIYNWSTDEPYLSNARDWLIIACHTGQRSEDLLDMAQESKDSFSIALNKLKADGLMSCQNISIFFRAKKTGSEVEVPLTLEVSSILLRRDGLPSPVSNQRLNEYIKLVCQQVGITEQVRGAKMMEKEINGESTYRKISGYYEKYELVTTHIGRRSFATNAYIKGRSLKAIMSVTGHTTTQECERYIKMAGTEYLEELRIQS